MAESYLGENTGKLGFGMMRLPKKGLGFDHKQVCEMVDRFMEAGLTYFDTAYVYTGSEEETRKALVERYPRDSFTIATKLNAGIPGITEKMAKKQFTTSLERTGAGYIDYYLLHALMGNMGCAHQSYLPTVNLDPGKCICLLKNFQFMLRSCLLIC